MVPLKFHTAPQGYECYMSCAVRGNPRPHVTWYRNNISLNTDINYYITNTCGVCSMLILRVGAKDMGEYKVIADSPLGRAESTTNLTVRGKGLLEEPDDGGVSQSSKYNFRNTSSSALLCKTINKSSDLFLVLKTVYFMKLWNQSASIFFFTIFCNV